MPKRSVEYIEKVDKAYQAIVVLSLDPNNTSLEYINMVQAAKDKKYTTNL